MSRPPAAVPRRGARRRGWRAAGSVLAALLASGPPGAGSPGAAPGAAPGPAPTLFQLAARADLVIHARVRAGALKYAQVEVLETIKGVAPAAFLRVAFRDFNLDRPPGTSPIVFADGGEEVLFLRPYPMPPKRRAKNPDLFELLHGPHGRLSLPAEGGAGRIEAVRSLVALAGADPEAQTRGLAAHLDSPNPDLAEAALLEFERLGAATPGHYRTLARLSGSTRNSLRAGALRLLAKVFAAGRGDEAPQEAGPIPVDPLGDAALALAAVRERARNDPDPGVRVAAVTALGAWPVRSDTDADLAAIAASDPSQDVRFEAKRIVFLKENADYIK